MKTFISSVIVLLCTLIVMGMALQKKSVVLERVGKHIEAKEQAWKLNREEDVNGGRVFHWQSGKQRVDASVITLASVSEAKTYLQNNITQVPVPYKSKLRNLGDEAFLYQSEGSKACMLLIRRGTIFIQVNADDLAHAEKFARHIVSLADSL